MQKQKGKGNAKRKLNNVTCGNKPENHVERKKINEISTKGKTIQIKQDIPKQRKKFLQQAEGDDTKIYQQPVARETERFWTKTWQPKNHNEKAEWINNITKESEGLEEGPKAEIYIG